MDNTKIKITCFDEVVEKDGFTYHEARRLIVGPNDTLIYASIDPERIAEAEEAANGE